MKSHQRSDGKKFHLHALVMLVSLLCLVACTMGRARPDQKRGTSRAGSKLSTSQAEGLAQSESGTSPREISLREDIATIEELRKNIPEEKRRENDALKETLSLLGEVKLPPQEHREKFNRIMRNMREKRRKEARKIRDNFNRRERRERESFLNQLRKEREQFEKRNVTKDERREFFDEQDVKRRSYFADERDKRREFESELRQQEADFNAMYRERTDEFNKELRVYTQRYNDWKKQMKVKASQDASPAQSTAPTTSTPVYEKLGADGN